MNQSLGSCSPTCRLNLSPTNAVEKLEWYALRWKIETFHKILKSGCKAEGSRLRTAPRLNFIAVFCIVSWRVFWMTMLDQTPPDAPAEMALTASEIRLLDQVLTNIPNTRKTLSYYLNKIARLGGYLARGSDPPPGNLVMWRGLSRLRDIEIGVSISPTLWVIGKPHRMDTMPPTDDTQKRHVRHSIRPRRNTTGKCSNMGQSSVEKSTPPGSGLSGNQQGGNSWPASRMSYLELTPVDRGHQAHATDDVADRHIRYAAAEARHFNDVFCSCSRGGSDCVQPERWGRNYWTRSHNPGVGCTAKVVGNEVPTRPSAATNA